MPDMVLNNIDIIRFDIVGIHFGYTFSQTKGLSPYSG
jgi:hypothetical protein